MTSRDSDTSQLFTKAIQAFRDSLPDEEKKHFRSYTDPEAMVSHLRGQVNITRSDQRVLACFTRIERFSSKWKPYFDAIDTLVSSHPEWAGLFWGALKLLFQLSHNYFTFFEKLVRMFETITSKLRVYSEHVEEYKRWKQDGGILFQHLLNRLSNLYCVMFQFCQQACRIFFFRSKGFRSQFGFIGRTLWTPFDSQFSNILSMMDKDEESLSKDLDLAEIKILLANYEKLESEVEEAQQYRYEQRQHAESVERATAEQRVRLIQQWIQPPTYMQVFEKEKHEQAPGSCSWFLAHTEYKRWLHAPLEQQSDGLVEFSQKVLMVFGAPGYGKTMLSVAAIDDLLLRLGPSQPSSNRVVLFFHFSRIRSNNNSPHDAYRALLVQLMQQCRNNLKLIDAASILMEFTGSGQLQATENEVESILSFGLQHYKESTIIVDGVDECSNPHLFLGQVYQMCDPISCKILLFSRPDLILPKVYRNSKSYLRLSRSTNISGIQQYLKLKVEEIVDSGLVPASLSIKDLVTELAARANSLFLWAKLMVSYLQSPALTPRDRCYAIDNLNTFEGLDSLYSRILHLMQNRLLPEREMASRIFRWLTVADRPLRAVELQVASAIRIAQPTSSDLDYIVDFENSLGQICGALVEICEDKTVQFIHLSVREFLVRNTGLSSGSIHSFTIDVRLAHAYVANCCLSCLVYDIPAAPLAGSFDTIPEPELIQARFPLLEYALQGWSTHTVMAFSNLATGPQSDMSHSIQSLEYLLSQWISNKNAVCAWIEASWLFKHPPNICVLASMIASWTLKDRAQFALQGKRFDLLKKIQMLSEDIDVLDLHWGYILKTEPNVIWESSLFIFSTLKLLAPSGPKTAELLLTDDPVSNPSQVSGQPQGTCLMSETTSSGTNVCTLTLFPSEAFIHPSHGFYPTARGGLFHGTMYNISRYIESVSTGWTIDYQLRLTNSTPGSGTHTVINIPDKEISCALWTSVYRGMAGILKIPVSFSGDMKEVSIFHSVFRMVPNNDQGKKEYGTQIVDPVVVDRLIDSARTSSLLCLPPTEYTRDVLWHQTIFSPNGSFLAVLRSSSFHGKDDALAIFGESSNQKALTPTYKFLAEQQAQASMSPFFHPHRPMICFKQKSRMIIWYYKLKGLSIFEVLPIKLKDMLDSKPIPIYDFELKSAGFSQCGSSLTGLATTNGSDLGNQVVRIALPAGPYEEFGLHNSVGVDLIAPVIHTEVRVPFSQSLPNISLDLSDDEEPPLQLVEQSIHVKEDNALNISFIEHYAESGAILLQDFNEGQNAHLSAALLRLPQNLNKIKLRATITNLHDDSRFLRIMLNKPPQDTYDLRTPCPIKFPILVQRRKNTIQAYTPPQTLIEAFSEDPKDEESPVLDSAEERLAWIIGRRSSFGIFRSRYLSSFYWDNLNTIARVDRDFLPALSRASQISLWLAEFHQAYHILVASRQMLPQTSTRTLQPRRDRHVRYPLAIKTVIEPLLIAQGPFLQSPELYVYEVDPTETKEKHMLVKSWQLIVFSSRWHPELGGWPHYSERTRGIIIGITLAFLFQWLAPLVESWLFG